MKILLSILSLSLITACNDRSGVDIAPLPPEPSKVFITKLVDSLGTVTVSLPIRYDTSFSWTQYSDCGKPCSNIKYRSQPKRLRITKESGWLWKGELQDSIERFTISHSGYFPFHKNDDTTFILRFHEAWKGELMQRPDTYRIKSDTIEMIGDRYFTIFVIDLYDTTKAQFSKKLLAATTIKSNIVFFSFELLTKVKSMATDRFIDRSMYCLRTLRLSNGK